MWYSHKPFKDIHVLYHKKPLVHPKRLISYEFHLGVYVRNRTLREQVDSVAQMRIAEGIYTLNSCGEIGIPSLSLIMVEVIYPLYQKVKNL